uniref:Immunoglobulin V-set domain-containing protein n=1 Tax=Sinocyclocheilus rhinocerous TaxID=307959 RepID=A0A673FPY4_9TELE
MLLWLNSYAVHQRSLFIMMFLFSGVAGASVTVIGHRGERADIRCTYESGYESNPKYLCKGECIFGQRNIMVKSGSPAEDQRFSLSDDTTARVFTVTITDLRTEDEGQYWCGVDRTLTDDYSEIVFVFLLYVSGSVVIIVTAEALVLLLIGLPLIIVAVRKRKKTKGNNLHEISPFL